MWICNIVCAFISRALFILLSLTASFFLTLIKGDLYWCLTLLLLPMVLEMIVTMKTRRGEDYRWFSPPIFLFLISIVPSIWIIELEWMELLRRKLDYNETEHDNNATITGHEPCRTCDTPSVPKRNPLVLFFHQAMLVLLIVGRWLLPRGGGVTREELSQLLLNSIGTAADILEFSDMFADVPAKKPNIVYAILSVWSWSMLQFPVHMSVVSSKKDDGDEQVDQEESLWSKHSTDLWSIIESIFIQDGPYLVTRIIFLADYELSQMMCFFAIKNSLVISLNLYRLVAICQNYRQSSGSSTSSIELTEP